MIVSILSQIIELACCGEKEEKKPVNGQDINISLFLPLLLLLLSLPLSLSLSLSSFLFYPLQVGRSRRIRLGVSQGTLYLTIITYCCYYPYSSYSYNLIASAAFLFYFFRFEFAGPKCKIKKKSKLVCRPLT